MISTKIAFSLVGRKNVHRKSGREWALEWALNAQLVGHEVWTIKTWERKPTASEVADTEQVIIRAFEFYHDHLRIPSFKMDIVRQATE